MRLLVNEQQAQVIVEALDLYSRILIGQYEIAGEVGVDYNVHNLKEHDYKAFHAFSDEIRELKAKYLGFHRNGSHGIHSPNVHDNARVAYDIQQVVRYNLAWKRKPEGDIGVSYQAVYQTSEQPLPTIEE